jgi:hypothetical protein
MIMMVFRARSSTSRIFFAVIAVRALAGTPRVAHADDDDLLDGTPPPSSASHSVETGAFLPSALSATSEGRRGIVSIMGGWDRARHGGIYDAAAEAHILGPVSLLAGASSDGPGTTTSPQLELRLDALRQATHGVDMAVAAGYVDAGFNTVPAAVLKVAIGRNVGNSYLLGNVVYGQGLQDGERFGELRLAALYPVGHAAHVGIDSRFQIDLERDNDEPAGETDWESRTGLVASYEWNRIVFSSSAGVSALRLRAGGPTTVGPVVTAGFGTVF